MSIGFDDLECDLDDLDESENLEEFDLHINDFDGLQGYFMITEEHLKPFAQEFKGPQENEHSCSEIYILRRKESLRSKLFADIFFGEDSFDGLDYALGSFKSRNLFQTIQRYKRWCFIKFMTIDYELEDFVDALRSKIIKEKAAKSEGKRLQAQALQDREDLKKVTRFKRAVRKPKGESRIKDNGAALGAHLRVQADVIETGELIYQKLSEEITSAASSLTISLHIGLSSPSLDEV